MIGDDDPVRADDTPDDLSRALRQLPRVEASPGFTTTVIARAALARRGGPSSPRWWPWLRPALAAAVIVAVAAVGYWLRVSRPAATAELEQERRLRLVEEHRALQEELASLRELQLQSRPIVVLAEDDQVDVVLDVRRVAAEHAQRRQPLQVTPVGYRGQ